MRKCSIRFNSKRFGVSIKNNERLAKECHEAVNHKGAQLMQNTLLQTLLLRAGVWA